MITSTKPSLLNTLQVTSLDELYSIVNALSLGMIEICEGLAEELIACRNEDPAQVFKDLVEHETDHMKLIYEQAEVAGAKIPVEINQAWHELNLKNDQAREIAANPYLMTPYRAFRLAVAIKERIFETLTTLASNTEDDIIRQHAEALARGQLSEIAELRLYRRRASRSEIKSAIMEMGFDAPPVDRDDFSRVTRSVDAVILSMALIIRKTWAFEIAENTERVLRDLQDDFREIQDMHEDKIDRAELESRLRQRNDNLFSALRSLLGELESATDLFLGFAEDARSELVVKAAQTEAEQYVHRIAEIRDELNALLLEATPSGT